MEASWFEWHYHRRTAGECVLPHSRRAQQSIRQQNTRGHYFKADTATRGPWIMSTRWIAQQETFPMMHRAHDVSWEISDEYLWCIDRLCQWVIKKVIAKHLPERLIGKCKAMNIAVAIFIVECNGLATLLPNYGNVVRLWMTSVSFALYYSRWLPGFARVPYYAPSPCHMYTPMP